MEQRRQLAAIMFTDIVGYSRLMSGDETAALHYLGRTRKLVKRLARRYKGTWLESIGDGNLLRFNSATDAANCALHLQQELSGDDEAGLRIGIHVGEVIESESHVYGDGVNVASRIQQLAEPGGIIVSETVYDAIRNKKGLEARALGPQELKNLDHPFQVYELSGEPSRPASIAGIDVPEGRRGWALTILVAVAGIAAVVAAATWTVQRQASASPSSVAVLPFENLSGDPGYDYFGDGLAEELITTLSRVGDLRVAARSSSFYYKNRAAGVREIGDRLNVGSVLEGSVRRSENRLRVSVQLVDARNAFQIWSETFDTGMDDIFEVQDRIASSVARRLVTTLTDADTDELKRRPTSDVVAYDHYLRGRAYMQEPKETGVIQDAIAAYRSAIRRDPGFAEAHAGLCEAHVSYYERTRNPEHAQAAEDSCDAALDLSHELPEVRTAIGNLYRITGRLQQAEEQLLIASRESDQPALALRTLGNVYLSQGRRDEARQAFLQAIESEPANQRGYTALGNFYYRTDQFQSAIEQYLKAADLAPEAAPVYTNLGAAYYMSGRFREAAEAWERSNELQPTYEILFNLGEMYYLQLGDFPKAAEAYRQAAQLAPDRHYAWGRLGAALNQMSGETAEARNAYLKAQDVARQELSINPRDFETHAYLALYCARTGEFSCTEEHIDRARELNAQDPLLDFIEARIHVGRDNERAASLVRAALERGYPEHVIMSEPELDELELPFELSALPESPAGEEDGQDKGEEDK